MFKSQKSKRYKTRRQRRIKKHTLFVSYGDNKKSDGLLRLPSLSVLRKAVCIFMVLFFILPVTRLLGESTFNFFTEDTFNLKTIKVVNNILYSSDEVLSIADIESEGSVFDINITDIKNRLEADSNIAQAIVVRIIPNTISIKIYEKMPSMIAISGKKEYFVDKNGEVLSWDKSRIKSILPKVEGIEIKNYGEKHAILGTIFEIYESYNNFTDIKADLGFDKFELEDPYRIVMQVDEDRKIYFSKDIDFAKVFSKLKLVLEDISEKGKVFKAVDLRFNDVVVKGLK